MHMHTHIRNKKGSYTPGRLIVSISTSFLWCNMSPLRFPPSHSAFSYRKEAPLVIETCPLSGIGVVSNCNTTGTS